MVTSGIRLGTPAGTTRGFGVGEFRHVGDLIAEVLDAVAAADGQPVPEAEAGVRDQVKALCRSSRFTRRISCVVPIA